MIMSIKFLHHRVKALKKIIVEVTRVQVIDRYIIIWHSRFIYEIVDGIFGVMVFEPVTKEK